jgi:hypothetical protein
VAIRDSWNPERCVRETAGAGIIALTHWDKRSSKPKFLNDSDLQKIFEKELSSSPIPQVVLTHKGNLGDSILCTAVAFELNRRGVKEVWLETRWHEDFADQPVFKKVIDQTYENEWLVEKLGGILVYPQYCHDVPNLDVTYAPREHVIAAMCRSAGLIGKVAMRPIYVTSGAKLPVKLPEKYVAIQGVGSYGSLFPHLTRDWSHDKFQMLVNQLAKEIPVVQIGIGLEPPLNNTLDLRGKLRLKEAALVLENAHFYIGQVNGLMHLARAVNTPSIVIYGGRETPEQSGYSCNVNIYSKIECSPCWIRLHCPHGMRCMNEIMPSDVFKEATVLLSKPRQSQLKTDIKLIEPHGLTP